MAIEFKNHPWLGVAIPSILILYLQISTCFLMLKNLNFDYEKLIYNNYYIILFHFSNLMLWFSYYLAITTNPGSPPKDFKLSKNEFDQPQSIWRKYCIKCDNYKPDRCHHCKKCNKCILKMDHHCPWTMNCIGYYNYPFFIRFLFWVLSSLTFGLIYYFKNVYSIYKMRNLPYYLISKNLIAINLINFLLVFLVFLSILILFIRCLSSLISNQTMIESWEWDRIRDNFFTEKFWIKIRSNYKLLYPNKPDPIPNLKSWKINYRILKKDTQIPLNFSFDDLVFPYDLGSSYQNLLDSLGPIYTWLYPFGKPTGNGLDFIKDNLGDDQLKLPFPMDGSNFDKDNYLTDNDDDNELVIKNWSNYLGETLDDFGVDLDTEIYESTTTYNNKVKKNI